MKWLLVSTSWANPGDQFIRLGCEKLVRAVDPEATVEIVDKENPPRVALRHLEVRQNFVVRDAVVLVIPHPPLSRHFLVGRFVATFDEGTKK